MFKRFKTNAAINRLVEERLYELALEEVEKGQIRKGIWARALGNSEGSGDKAQSLYILYRVESMKDEAQVISAIIDDIEKQNSRTLSNAAAFTPNQSAQSSQNASQATLVAQQEKQDKQANRAEEKASQQRLNIERLIQEEKWHKIDISAINSWPKNHKRSLEEFIRSYEMANYPLHKAAWKGEAPKVKILLMLGFSTQIKNDDGHDVRDMAVGDTEIITIVRGAP